MADFKIGDVVAVDDPKFPGPWVVEKVNPTTYRLTSDQHPRGLRAHHSLVRAYTSELRPSEVVDPRGGLPATDVGTVVRYTGRHPKAGAGTLYVVLKDNWDTLKVAKLGGDNGRYWPKLPARDFEVFEIANVDGYISKLKQFKAVA